MIKEKNQIGRRVRALTSLIFLLTCGSGPPIIWDIPPGRSSVGFSVRHMMFTRVKGKFKEYEGKVITSSLTDFTTAKIQAKIPVNSVYTGNRDRDSHLLTDDFFDAVNHPYMLFKSKSIRELSNNRYKMIGDLTIKGITKPVEFDVINLYQKEIYGGRIKSHFRATSTINRYTFGLKWNDIAETGGMLVDKNVKIDMDIYLMSKEK